MSLFNLDIASMVFIIIILFLVLLFVAIAWQAWLDYKAATRGLELDYWADVNGDTYHAEDKTS